MSEDGVFMIKGVPILVRDQGQLPGYHAPLDTREMGPGVVSKEYSIGRLSSVVHGDITL